MEKFIELDGNYINVAHIVRVKKEVVHSSYAGDYTTYELLLSNSHASMTLTEEKYNEIIAKL
jgi:hypothetical protein